MRLSLAFRAFWKAWQDPKKALRFVESEDEKAEVGDLSHLRLLSLLQHSGRLVDFLKEDISSYSDAQIGAAVRQIQSDCAKSLEDLVTIRPVMEEKRAIRLKYLWAMIRCALRL